MTAYNKLYKGFGKGRSKKLAKETVSAQILTDFYKEKPDFLFEMQELKKRKNISV